jgi:endonuclease G, mitochondrial
MAAARPSRSRNRASRRPRRRVWRFAVWLNLILATILLGWYAMQPAERQGEVRSLLRNYVEREKGIRLVDVAWDIYQLYYQDAFVAAPRPATRSLSYGGLPQVGAFPHPVRVLPNTGYIAGYADALGAPVWVTYQVRDLRPLPPAPERPERFEIDRRTVARVAPEDFTNSGYDRGHLAPNYAIATRFGPDAQRETFLMSNIVPQRHALNAGAWKQLEQKVATTYPGRFTEVWVIAGPIFGPQPARLRRAAVPDAFYMIVLDEGNDGVRAQAFIFAQDTAAGVGIASGLVTIDEIEARTGLDFLVELEDVAEAQLESRRAERVW